MSEIPASNASDDEEQVEREMDDLPEDNDGPGWTIPDGNSTGSTAQEEEESESSKDGSQKVHQSMFTDSDGGSTIKMNEQCHSDATQTGEDAPGAHFIDPSNMDTDQSNSDAKGEGQFIVTERELDKDNDSETMSETSDIVNNNKMQSPRQISPEEQRSLLESLPSSNKLRTVPSSGSLFSEEGYQTFPGAEQSQELLKREVYGHEDDNESEAVSSCTDTSNLAQLIVDHVLENVVGSVQDESDSDSSLKQIVENLENALETEENEESMDQREEEQVLEDKGYASKMELDTDLKIDEEAMTDFQLNDPQPIGEEVREENDEKVIDGGDEEIEVRLPEDNTAFDSEDRAVEGAQAMDQLSSQSEVPGVEQTPEVDEENVDDKQLDNGGSTRLLKSKDSGVSMSYAGEIIGNSQSAGAVASTSSNVSDRISDTIPGRRNLSDSLQEYDTQRLSDNVVEPMAEKPYEEDSTFKRLTPEEATISSAEISVPESFADQKENSNLAYTAVSSPGYTEPSSVRADQSSGFLASQETDSQLSYERNSSPAKPIQTPPRMVLRTKQDFVVSGNRSEKDPSSNVRGQGQQHQREAEMHREQLILDKVRKDMAAKEREMRRQIDREMTERMERARLQQELLSNGGEYYRSENDLSMNPYDQSNEFDITESSRLKYSDQSSSRSPINAGSRSMPTRSSSDLRVSEEELIRRYQRELSRSEQRHYDVSGIDTYATLQNQHHRNESVSLDDPLRMEGMSYADINRSDRGMPSNIYSSYNIPPPQYNVSTSFGAQNSSHTSSDLEAPPPKSGSVPPFKTLHEQQIGWMRMFKTLEEQHHNELKNQYRQHQETIFSMQHQIESELLNQQQTLKQKLSAHKEALSNNASPIKPNQDRRLNHSQLSGQTLESSRVDSSYKKSGSPKSSPNARHMERSHHSDRHASPPWKDIYREIRGKGVDSDRETEDNEEEATPIRRSLEDDFMSTSSMLRQPLSEEIRPTPKKYFDPLLSEPPRGGVYSSPMPVLRKSNISQSSTRTPSPRQADRNSPRVASGNDLSQRGDRTDSRLLDSLADVPMESMTSEESASQRAHLREKHAKHLLDLREYYEQEIHDLRLALSRSDDITSRSPFKRVANENQALITENHSLKHTNEELESQLNKVVRENRELEQKVHGLERRASEYADCYKEAQDKISTFRNKVEELQYQNRTMEDQLQHLECQLKNQADAIKHYKKSQDEQMEVLQKDRNAYHKLSDKYDNLEREFNILKESFNSTENKLYDARSEVVELNRTVSKLELENKRLGRENDNIRYKLTQSANAVTMQGNADDSYSSPGRIRHQSPARESGLQKSYGKMTDNSPESAHARSRSQEIPIRLLGDRPMDRDLHPDRQVRSRSQVDSFCEEMETSLRVREQSTERRPKNTCNTYAEVEEIEKSHQRPRSAPSSRNAPERQMSPGVDQTSPVLRAERELYKLREIMRQAEQVVEASPPQHPKLQKKFYGSESALSSSKSDSGSSIHKSDSSSSLKLKKKKSVNTSPVKSPKVRTSMSSRFQDSDPLSPPSKAKFETSPGEFDTPTRFDIGVMERSSSRRQHSDSLPTRDTGSKPRQSPATRDKRNGEVRGGNKAGRDRKPLKAEKDTQVPNGTVENTLAKMKEGEFVSRPGWEDVYTSMAKPKSDSKATPVKQTVKNRMDNISDLEARYDELQTEKRTLESKLSRVPSHGKGRQEQENLENKLDTVEKELGSVRMSLKRYHVLKTSI